MDDSKKAQENLLKKHKDMATELASSVSVDTLSKLKLHFKRKPISPNELERIRNFSQLWEALEDHGTIAICDYKALKEAFETLPGCSSQLSVIKKYEIWITSLGQTVEDKK